MSERRTNLSPPKRTHTEDPGAHELGKKTTTLQRGLSSCANLFSPRFVRVGRPLLRCPLRALRVSQELAGSDNPGRKGQQRAVVRRSTRDRGVSAEARRCRAG